MRRLCVLLLAGSCVSGLAAEPSKIPGYRFESPPKIDGNLDPSEWKDVPFVDGCFDEETGDPGKLKQKFWIGYDAQYIYFAAEIEEPEQKSIYGHETRPNVEFGGDDFVALALDPFGAGNSLNRFDVNPLGTTNIRMSGGRAAKREWLGDMLGAAQRTATGWTVEARIPWAVMQLPGPGKRDLRIVFVCWRRAYLRSFTTDNISGDNLSSIARWTDIEIPKIDHSRSIKLLPYGYAGVDRRGEIANMGLDFKSALTESLELVGSINPDFRNIERQVLSLDFSYFERLADESRPFFLEGSEYFQTSRDAPLFASQRIRTFDAGLKTYGKIGDRLTVAALDTLDFGKENAFVTTTRYDFSQRTSATLSLASLENKQVSNTGTYAGLLHGMGSWLYFGQFMTTQDTEEGFGRRINTGVFFNQKGWNVGGEYIEVTNGFRPRLGFAPRKNFRGIFAMAEYEKPIERGPFSIVSGGVFLNDYRKIEGGGNFSRGLDAFFEAGMRNGIGAEVGIHAEDFEDNKDMAYSFGLRFPREDAFRNVRLSGTFGRLGGSRYQSLSTGVNFRPLKNLQVSASYQSVQSLEREDQSILSLSYQLNRYQALSGRTVYRNGKVNGYLSFRQSGGHGTEYFFIVGDPNAETFRSSLILKVVVPLEVRY